MTSEKPNCFPPQDLFRRANLEDSYVSAAELRRGDRIVGPGGDGVLVVSAQQHPRKFRNIVRIRAGQSDAVLVVTSDHRVQVDPGGEFQSAGAIVRKFNQGEHPVVSDGSRVHVVKEATYRKERTAVIEVKFAGDDVAFVWLRPRRWRSRSADCPRIVVRGERPDAISLHVGAAALPEEQEARYGFTCRRSFIDDFQHASGIISRRSNSAPPRAPRH